MPGIFGGTGAPADSCETLRREFAAAWPESRARPLPDGVLGGHAFGPAAALHDAPGGMQFVVDGEASLYPAAADHASGCGEPLFRVDAGVLELSPGCAGNVAAWEPSTGALHVASEWTGTFPLFFAETGGGLLFSSLLRPLARACRAAPDEVGVLEFLRQAYTVAGRTQFRGIRRLLPGQALRFRDGRLQLLERSRAWAGGADETASPAEVAERSWALLARTVGQAVPEGGRSALMMSAGWDSRTLFAAARGAPGSDGFACYSHGDVRSRELAIVERMCRSAGVPVRLEPIDERVWEPDALAHGFARTGSVVFPHWHRAGRLLAESGARSVFSGVYGEILGGHYGPAMLASGGKKLAALAAAMFSPGRAWPAAAADLSSVRETIRVRGLERHWYLDRDYEAGIEQPLDAMNAGIDGALDRLEARGVSRREQLVEAFVSEHRGTQYINAQLLSCRASLDVSLPFADRETFVLASRLPLPVKIHNNVNRELLRRHAPSLLRYPLAATLVSAGAPLPAQEASRVARNVWERGRWKLHFRSGGAVAPPRLGWVNFEFLRDGRALHRLIDELRADLWNRDALRARVGEIRTRAWGQQLHPIYDQLSKIYTTDLLLR